MSDVIMALVFTEAKSALDGNTGTIVDRLKAAMEAVKDHWMCPPEDTKFRAAVAAVMESYGAGSAEYERIKLECQQLCRRRKLVYMWSCPKAIIVLSLLEL